MDRLKKRGHGRVAGLKETKKHLLKGAVAVLYIADDADIRLVSPLIEDAGSRDVEVVHVPTMAELGRLSGIEVGAAVAAILRE